MRVFTSLAIAALVTGCASSPEGDAGGSYDPHTMNVIVGGSFDRAGDGAAVGASYEYRKTKQLGAGAFGDVAFARETSTTIGGAIFVHPAQQWTLFAGPGVEFVEGDADVIVRVGGSYLIPMDNLAIGPTAWVDVGHGAAFFLGLSLAFSL